MAILKNYLFEFRQSIQVKDFFEVAYPIGTDVEF